MGAIVRIKTSCFGVAPVKCLTIIIYIIPIFVILGRINLAAQLLDRQYLLIYFHPNFIIFIKVIWSSLMIIWILREAALVRDTWVGWGFKFFLFSALLNFHAPLPGIRSSFFRERLTSLFIGIIKGKRRRKNIWRIGNVFVATELCRNLAKIIVCWKIWILPDTHTPSKCKWTRTIIIRFYLALFKFLMIFFLNARLGGHVPFWPLKY